MSSERNWKRSAVECQACGYRWAAVSVADAPDDGLECPACKQMAGEVPTVEEFAKWQGYMYKESKP